MTRDLRRRGGGVRESGAFLLARAERDPDRVIEWIPFDELDPAALNGAISLRAPAFSKLWRLCRERGLRVVADVHTHPGSGVAQSSVDAANPMVRSAGHVAIILPRFAAGRPRPRHAGVHVHRGQQRWSSYFDGDAARIVRLTWI